MNSWTANLPRNVNCGQSQCGMVILFLESNSRQGNLIDDTAHNKQRV